MFFQQIIAKGAVEQVHCRHVERQSQVIGPVRRFQQGGASDVPRQPSCDPARLCDGYHSIACHPAMLAMLPAQQSLRPGQRAIARTELGLEKKFHRTGSQRRAKILADGMRLASAAIKFAPAFVYLDRNGHENTLAQITGQVFACDTLVANRDGAP